MNIKLEDIIKYRFILKYPKGKKMSKDKCIDYVYKNRQDKSYVVYKKKYISYFDYIINSLTHGELVNRYMDIISFPRNMKIFNYINTVMQESFIDIEINNTNIIDSLLYFNIILFSHIRSYKTIAKLKNEEYLKSILLTDDNILYPNALYEMIEEFPIILAELEEELKDIKKEYNLNPPRKSILLIGHNKLHSDRINLIYSIMNTIHENDNFHSSFVILPLFTIIVYFLTKKYNICNFKYLGKKENKYEIDLENLFRGKSLEDNNDYSKGEWVYGKVVDNNYIIPIGTNYTVMIDKNTLSKFIGKTDAYDKKIFDGDILNASRNNGIVEWDKDKSKYVIKTANLGSYKIITNKWDSPELASAIYINNKNGEDK